MVVEGRGTAARRYARSVLHTAARAAAYVVPVLHQLLPTDSDAAAPQSSSPAAFRQGLLAVHPHGFVVAVAEVPDRGDREEAVFIFDSPRTMVDGAAVPPGECVSATMAAGQRTGPSRGGTGPTTASCPSPTCVLRHCFQRDVSALAWKPRSQGTLAMGCRGGVLLWHVPMISTPGEGPAAGWRGGDVTTPPVLLLRATCIFYPFGRSLFPAAHRTAPSVTQLSFTHGDGRFLAIASAQSRHLVVVDVFRPPTASNSSSAPLPVPPQPPSVHQEGAVGGYQGAVTVFADAVTIRSLRLGVSSLSFSVEDDYLLVAVGCTMRIYETRCWTHRDVSFGSSDKLHGIATLRPLYSHGLRREASDGPGVLVTFDRLEGFVIGTITADDDSVVANSPHDPAGRKPSGSQWGATDTPASPGMGATNAAASPAAGVSVVAWLSCFVVSPAAAVRYLLTPSSPGRASRGLGTSRVGFRFAAVVSTERLGTLGDVGGAVRAVAVDATGDSTRLALTLDSGHVALVRVELASLLGRGSSEGAAARASSSQQDWPDNLAGPGAVEASQCIHCVGVVRAKDAAALAYFPMSGVNRTRCPPLSLLAVLLTTSQRQEKPSSAIVTFLPQYYDRVL